MRAGRKRGSKCVHKPTRADSRPVTRAEFKRFFTQSTQSLTPVTEKPIAMDSALPAMPAVDAGIALNPMPDKGSPASAAPKATAADPPQFSQPSSPLPQLMGHPSYPVTLRADEELRLLLSSLPCKADLEEMVS